jgi:hypothetical protein
LKRGEFGGDRILGGEGRDSLRNPPRNGEEAPNRLGIANDAGVRSFGERGVQMMSRKMVKEFYT